MSVLSKVEAEVSAVDKTKFGAQLFRAVRLAASVALGSLVIHLTSITGTSSISAVIGGAAVAGEVAFRTVFPTTSHPDVTPAPSQPQSTPVSS